MNCPVQARGGPAIQKLPSREALALPSEAGKTLPSTPQTPSWRILRTSSQSKEDNFDSQQDSQDFAEPKPRAVDVKGGFRTHGFEGITACQQSVIPSQLGKVATRYPNQNCPMVSWRSRSSSTRVYVAFLGPHGFGIPRCTTGYGLNRKHTLQKTAVNHRVDDLKHTSERPECWLNGKL